MSLRTICLYAFVMLGTTIRANSARDDIDCFASNKDYRCHLNSMTPYRFIANADDSVLEYSDCSPRKLWILLRHGTRYPGKKWTARIINRLPAIRNSIVESHDRGLGTIDESTVKLLRNWQPTFLNENPMDLNAEGELELNGLAERFQSRLPSLLPEIYSNRTYRFKYTATQRAEESAKHFALGLFGRKQSRSVWYPHPESRDPVLRFYSLCERWNNEINRNPETLRETEKFLASSVVRQMLEEVSERVGFAIDYDSVNLIHKICAYETAWNKKIDSPWCNILSIDHFKIVEFAHDSQYYWIDGYGHSLTYMQACTATRDMFDFFDSDDETKTVAYFTHLGTVLKLLALLGVARDENPLLHDSFSLDGKRAWRTSLIGACASNIAFVLYDCKTQGPSILVMHQERVVNLAGCPVDKPCPLTTMKDKYPDTESECPFEDMCATQK